MKGYVSSGFAEYPKFLKEAVPQQRTEWKLGDRVEIVSCLWCWKGFLDGYVQKGAQKGTEDTWELFSLFMRHTQM